MILSVSRRTDIPAFYSDWFFNCIKKGYVLVRNPMNIHQVSKISLKPEIVDCIVFWTKNPKCFIERLHLIEKYKFYFQYTLTGYGKSLEPNVPSFEASIETFIQLSKKIGKDKVIWRYDPMIITNKFDVNYHINQFEKIAKKLTGYTNKCVISFVDFYKKTIKNLSSINYSEITKHQINKIASEINLIGKSYNITITSCAEEIDLSKQGIFHGRCIDDKLITEIFGFNLKIGKDKNQRSECGCVASIDIGAYNSCPHGCLYCYANFNLNQVHQNFYTHNKYSELLLGNITDRDKITERKVLSCKIVQKSLFDKTNEF